MNDQQMDRTAILGDTIDYMKELMEKVKNLQEEDRNYATLNQVSKDLKPNELLGRNSPKVYIRAQTSNLNSSCQQDYLLNQTIVKNPVPKTQFCAPNLFSSM